MSAALAIGSFLDSETWDRLRMRAIFDCCKWDPHSQDNFVLARYPIILDASAFGDLRGFSERLSVEALEAEKEILLRPDLWKELGIPRVIRHALKPDHNQPNHVRVMRFDFHLTDEGWRISEVNADVPGGYVEGTGWNSLFESEFDGLRAPVSPSLSLVRAICEEMRRDGIVALVHATNYSDDRQVMMHLAAEFRRVGIRAPLAGPANIEWSRGKAFLRNGSRLVETAAAIRFFPAEWLPQLRPRERWEGWFAESQTILCNPGSAILLQSKRFPLIWKSLNTKLDAWKRLLPTMTEPEEIAERDYGEWVIKPALGRVGEDVGMKGITGDAEIRKLWRSARWSSRKWIAQRRFRTLPLATEEGNVYPCCGVFTVNGKFAGIYGRAARTPLINHEAQDVAVLVRADFQRGVQ